MAERHYLTVNGDHWERAVESRPLIANGAESITSNQKTKKPLENMAYDASQGFLMTSLVPPQGLEPWTR